MKEEKEEVEKEEEEEKEQGEEPRRGALPPPSWLHFTGTLVLLAVRLPLALFLCTSMHVSSRLLSWLLPGRINPKIDFFFFFL